jgi:signal transduction histidine kinase
VVALLALIGLGRLARDGTLDSGTVTLTAGLVLPLLLRRRAPTAVFVVVVAVVFLQWLDGRPLAADVGILVALYTLAAYRPTAEAIAGAVVLEGAAALGATEWTSAEGSFLSRFVFLSGLIIAALVIGLNVRTRRAYLAALEDRAARLEAERDTRSRLAVASERARIAREMHDIVTHNLSVMIALADGAGYVIEPSPAEAATAMQQVAATGRTALREMRRLLGVLRDDDGTEPLEPQPGLEQLDDLLDQVRAAGLPTRLEISGTPFAMGAVAELSVYRLVQEGLTNCMKHARAASGATVALAYHDDHRLLIDVVDDGAPAVDVSQHGEGHGLTGLRERAELFDGRAEAGPRAGGGWRVHVELDLSSATP